MMTTTELEAAPADFIDKIDPKDRKRLGLRTREEIEHSNTLQDERALQNQIADYLRVKDIPFAQQRMDRKSNVVVGWPDFTFAYFGKPIAFEAKTGTGKQSDAQYQMQNRMELNGWKYFVITSLDQVRAILTAIEVSV